MFVYAAAPGQSTDVANKDTVWWLLTNSYTGAYTVDTRTYPPDTTPPLVNKVFLTIDYASRQDDVWPVYDVDTKKYNGRVCT